jgi:ferredoxin
VLDFEQVSKMVDRAKHYVVSDCPCCRKMKLLGKDCGRRVHRCISLYQEDDFRAEIRIEYREGKRSTKEEVLNLLRTVEEEGFIHTGVNMQDGHSHICNCCPDCCPFLRMIRLGKSPYIIAAANYVACIDPDICVACGLCAEERCPVDAIESDNDHYEVNTWRCIGCGACVLACPSGALSLVQKEEGQLYTPPLNILEWFIKRAARERHLVRSPS